MWYTLTLDGVPLGRVELTGAPRAVGLLVPLSAYEAIGLRTPAKRLGLGLRLLGAQSVPGSAASRALAGALAQWAALGDRLGLTDIRGAHAAIVHIVVAEFPRDDAPVVVAELREQAAPRQALTAQIGGGPGDRSRPAA